MEENKFLEYLLDKIVWVILIPMAWFWFKSINEKLEKLTNAITEFKVITENNKERFDSVDKTFERLDKRLDSHSERLRIVETKKI